ncbi:hypothetical protein B0H14DRAFT_1482357 [Mycena olivaceomarginata]|nr:hypothetical protein B0H14DRAFT_1482357 [Mycena olivaceomarginata]
MEEAERCKRSAGEAIDGWHKNRCMEWHVPLSWSPALSLSSSCRCSRSPGPRLRLRLGRGIGIARADEDDTETCKSAREANRVKQSDPVSADARRLKEGHNQENEKTHPPSPSPSLYCDLGGGSLWMRRNRCCRRGGYRTDTSQPTKERHRRPRSSGARTENPPSFSLSLLRAGRVIGGDADAAGAAGIDADAGIDGAAKHGIAVSEEPQVKI